MTRSRRSELFDRRQFFATAGASGLLLALGACSGDDDGDGARSLGATSSEPSPSTAPPPVPRRTTTLRPAGKHLALPDGFEYTVVQSGEDGTMPPAPDGMTCVANRRGRVRLVRNHERADPAGTVPALDAATAYDAKAPGGVLTLVLAADQRSLVRTHVSLSGTVQNCAGGLTPWGTWLSCEETNEGPEAGWDRPHGYVFEVDPFAGEPAAGKPLKALGRFLHEAVVVEPRTGVLYLTEDNGYDSGLYRFTPSVPGRLARGGTLEALAIADRPEYDTAYAQRVGRRLPVKWVRIDDVDPSAAGVDPSAVFNQGLGRGGARFKRAEGCCLVGRTWYVAATEGGDAGLGQVWAYDIAASELRLVYEPAAPDDLFGPDNITAPPHGRGMILCEDNGEFSRLQILLPNGTLVPFAENLADTSEFTGPCWSPDGSVLYVNTYGNEAAGVPGRTLAIWGPWRSLGR